MYVSACGCVCVLCVHTQRRSPERPLSQLVSGCPRPPPTPCLVLAAFLLQLLVPSPPLMHLLSQRTGFSSQLPSPPPAAFRPRLRLAVRGLWPGLPWARLFHSWACSQAPSLLGAPPEAWEPVGPGAGPTESAGRRGTASALEPGPPRSGSQHRQVPGGRPSGAQAAWPAGRPRADPVCVLRQFIYLESHFLPGSVPNTALWRGLKEVALEGSTWHRLRLTGT